MSVIAIYYCYFVFSKRVMKVCFFFLSLIHSLFRHQSCDKTFFSTYSPVGHITGLQIHAFLQSISEHFQLLLTLNLIADSVSQADNRYTSSQIQYEMILDSLHHLIILNDARSRSDQRWITSAISGRELLNLHFPALTNLKGVYKAFLSDGLFPTQTKRCWPHTSSPPLLLYSCKIFVQ